MAKAIQIQTPENNLLDELCRLIDQSRSKALSYTSSMVAGLFWQVGKRINENILLDKRADYGKQIVVKTSQQLKERYGNNFEEKNLRRMMQFAQLFNDFEIVVTVSRQLSWSHFISFC